MSLELEIPLALRAAYLALHRSSDLAFSPYDITADQFVLLNSLAKGEALTQRELARRMSSDPSTVRAMLVLLERQGLVLRAAHHTDSRARTVALTAEGHARYQQVLQAGAAVRQQLTDVLTAAEAHNLVDLLGKVASACTQVEATRS